MTAPDHTLAARLLPCPFCGGEAEVRYNTNYSTHNHMVTVLCLNKKCGTKIQGQEYSHYNNQEEIYQRESQPIANWNSRAPDHTAAVAKAVEAEREACASEADALSSEYWGEYKNIMSPHRADPHYQGMSDGAENVAAAIRSRGVAG